MSAIGTVLVRRRGRVSVRIHCPAACSVRGRLLAGKRLRKVLHRKRATLVNKVLIRNTAGADTLTLKLSKGTRARLHRRHRSKVPVTLNVRVRENDGKMTTTTRRLRITV